MDTSISSIITLDTSSSSIITMDTSSSSIITMDTSSPSVITMDTSGPGVVGETHAKGTGAHEALRPGGRQQTQMTAGMSGTRVPLDCNKSKTLYTFAQMPHL